MIILPSSVHEIIVLPYNDEDVYALKDMVIEVNKSSLDNEDFLSDSVYLYKRNEEKLTKVA